MLLSCMGKGKKWDEKVYDPRGRRFMWFAVDRLMEEQKDPGMK